MPIDQIQQREQINPNNVNEVPVAYIFDGVVIARRAFAGPKSTTKTGTDNQSVTGHAEIQREISGVVLRSGSTLVLDHLSLSELGRKVRTRRILAQ
jgi:hypothetical protein